MVDIKDYQRIRKHAMKPFVNAILPALRKIRLKIDILLEETIVMRDAQKVQHRPDQVEMRYQHGLSQVFAEVFIAGGNSLPELRRVFPQDFCIQLVQVRPHLEAFVNLIGSELADGDGAKELSESLFAQTHVDLGDLHKLKAYHGPAKPEAAGVA